MRQTVLRLIVLPAALAASWLWSVQSSAQPVKRWFKGNLHAHTVNSDGDSTPAEVVSWYREHGYHFLVLSDHNYLTEIDTLQRTHGARDRFVLIPGEEVTNTFNAKEIHVNGYGLKSEVPAQRGTSVVEVMQRSINAIRSAGGIASVNHPNYTWVIGSRELLAVSDLGLFEVFNGSWSVGNRGGGGFESNEEMWDAVLSAGRTLYGIAVDDAHDFKSYGRSLPYPPTLPGTGWIWVRAAELTPSAILRALQEGDFYASTGAILNDVQATHSQLTVKIRRTRDNLYRTYFIGKGGKILSVSDQLDSTYRFTGSEGYVRARVEESTGGDAWTQPVRVSAP